ncbi:MAG: hypothetical protein ABUU24_01670 [Variovorax sp.]
MLFKTPTKRDPMERIAMTHTSAEFSARHRFEDWPNTEVPAVAAGVYAVWDQDRLIYCGMSGREFEKAVSAARPKYGLVTRLASHASGRLSGDQFCVYVANRLVVPSLTLEQLPLFASGELNLDRLTKKYIHDRLEYQFAFAQTSKAAYEMERDCRNGSVFGAKPMLNPL